MHINSADNGARVVAKSAEAMKNVLQTAVNSNQEMSGKLIRMAAQEKVSGVSGQKVNYTA